MIIRAHQCIDDGYEYFHGDRGLTVFSATNYCGDQGNSGAIVIVRSKDNKFIIEPKVITPKLDKKYDRWDDEINNKYPESPRPFN